MPLNPTGSEIPRSLTQIGTTIDVALDGKADFVRITANPSTATAASSYAITGSFSYDGTPITGPASLDYVSANSWANSDGETSSLSVESGKWRLVYGDPLPQGSWLSVQTTATRPENCTWAPEDLVSGTPVLTFTRATVATTGQFALADDGVYDPVMWQNLGTDATPEWVALVKPSDLSSYATTSAVAATYAPLASPALTGNPTAPTQTSGNNSTRIATTAFVAAGYQPLDSDLTAIAALTTTSTGRALLTESSAQTGTGALVRAASPTFTGTLSAAAITASGRIETTSTENASSSLDGALRVAGGMSAQLNIQSGGTIRGRDLRSWQPSGGTIGWNNGPLLFNDNGTVRLRNEADTEFRHLSLGNLTASGTGTFEGEMRYRPGSVRALQFSLTAATVTGSGTSAVQGGSGWRQRTGGTANSTSIASWVVHSRHNTSTTGSGAFSGIAWNQPLSLSALFTPGGGSGLSSTGTHQIAFRSETTGGALVARGIGFERRNGYRLWLLVHNGTTSSEIDSGVDWPITRVNVVEVRSNGIGRVDLLLNNTQIATTNNGPTTITNTSDNNIRSYLVGTDTYNQDVIISHIEVQGI
jgi:hypothetical protein